MFRMDLGPDESRGHAVVALHGELDLVDAAVVIAGLVVVAAREPRIIVDLTALEFIDASGVAALSRGRGHARHAGGDLLLAAPQRRVQLILAIIWTAGGPVLHSSVAEAAASMGPRRQVVVPIQRPPARMRWQRATRHCPAAERQVARDDCFSRSSRAPCSRPRRHGGLSR